MIVKRRQSFIWSMEEVTMRPAGRKRIAFTLIICGEDSIKGERKRAYRVESV